MENNKENGLKKSFYQLYSIVKKLREPEGCEWDRAQSPESIRGNLIEESYECIDAIDKGDDENLREELGDLYLLVTMIGEMKEEEGSFSLEDVLKDISAKLIRRHPHVFGDSKVSSINEIINQWNDIKEKIEGKIIKGSILERIPKSLPPMERAIEIQKKVAKVGFDWPSLNPVWAKLKEEEQELKEASKRACEADIEEEFGDILFTLINLSRFYKVDASLALNRTNNKFVKRFQRLEAKLKSEKIRIEETKLKALDELWNQLKSEERLKSSKYETGSP